MNEPKCFSQQLIDAWNSHEMAQILPLYTPDYQGEDVGSSGVQRGHAGVEQIFQRYFNAFPDLKFTLVKSIHQAGEWAIFWKAHGTHGGELLRIPPTGRNVCVQGVSLLQTESESNFIRIHSAHNIWDMAGLLRSLGLLPRL